MHLKLRKIGNSRGIIIPASVLETLGIGNDLEMSVSKDSIILKASNTLREGWFESYQPEDDTEPLANLRDLASEQEDWEW
jgi:antitoxin MazE